MVSRWTESGPHDLRIICSLFPFLDLCHEICSLFPFLDLCHEIVRRLRGPLSVHRETMDPSHNVWDNGHHLDNGHPLDCLGLESFFCAESK